jgi:hypothetical protein
MVIVYFTIHCIIHWFVWVYGVEDDLWEHSIYFYFYNQTCKVNSNILYVTKSRRSCNNILTSNYSIWYFIYNTTWIAVHANLDDGFHTKTIFTDLYLFCDTSYDKVVQNPWRVGWVVISKVLCHRGHTLLLASDTMRLTDPSRKLCRRTHGKSFDNGLLLIQPCALHVYDHTVHRLTFRNPI